MDRQDEQNRALMDLTGSVKVIAAKMEDVMSVIKDHDEAIETLQRAPGEELLAISRQAKMRMVDRVVSALVGALIALITLVPQLAELAGKAKEVTP